MNPLAERFSKLFAGFEGAYGTYDQHATSKNAVKNGKVEIKSSARTIRSKVLNANWEGHLIGVTPLGIIPIREDGNCVWGCIDVDKYDISHAEMVRAILKHKFPLVVCRTKSGGAHLFMFTRSPIPAADMQAKLREMAAILGVGTSEIFPKQTTILAERGDLGNWLNMPYFSGDKTDRYAIKETMGGMTLSEFLNYAEGKRVDDVWKIESPKQTDEGLTDGPPCLQHLSNNGFPEGTRNNGLFALGVFCKKKFGEDWEEVLERYNQQFMSPPLGSEEVSELKKNLGKKDYNYRCSDQPCVSFCNSTVCRTRKYGVGGSEEFPVLTSLSYLHTDPPLWFADVDGQRVELTTDQLQNYRSFHKAAMEKLHVCYMTLKQDTWFKMVNSAMKDAIQIEVSDDLGVRGHFMELLEDFLFSRHQGEIKEDMLLGKPWKDEDGQRVYFRLRDFTEYLERARFMNYGRNKIGEELRQLGGPHFFNLKGKGVHCWWVRAESFTHKTGPVPLPQSQKEPI